MICEEWRELFFKGLEVFFCEVFPVLAVAFSLSILLSMVDVPVGGDVVDVSSVCVF